MESSVCASEKVEDPSSVLETKIKDEEVQKLQPEEQRKDWPWRRAKKVAIMISFCGKDYIGMQRNPGFKTIEEDLVRAFRDSGAIPNEWYETPQKAFFQRASRTDKGVSAAKMIVSTKLLCEPDTKTTIEKVNSFLPPEIRVQAIKRVTKNFNSKTACDARTYMYFMPTFAFAPIFPTNIQTGSEQKLESTDDQNVSSEDYVTKLDFRMSSELRDKVNSVLKIFLGAHYFHNYTSGKLPLEPSSQRFITKFECGQPFIRSNMEFVVIKVKGQSFMLHQIRKMIGMTIAVVRGHASLETIESTWGVYRVDVPRAPGLGLMLDEVHYDRYNKRFGKDGFHETLTWDAEEPEVETFKEKFIYPEMIEGEVKEFSMFEWLKNLPIHTFETRPFENEEPTSSVLRQAKRQAESEGSNGEKRSKFEDDDEDENGGDDDDEDENVEEKR